MGVVVRRWCCSTHTGNEVSSCVVEQSCMHFGFVKAVWLLWDCLWASSGLPVASQHLILDSLVPRLSNLFNVAREKRGSLVKLITCVTSGGTNFHIWHNSKLAKIKATDAKSSSSSISMLQSAMNQQAETLQSLFYELKTAICMVTRSCPRPGGTVGTIVQIAVFDTRRTD